MALIPELALDAQAELGEGPVWDSADQNLLWLDILRRRVNRFDPANGSNSFVQLDAETGSAVLTNLGEVLIGLGPDLCLLDEGTGRVRHLAAAPKGDRFNDGKCDARGRFFGGTMTRDQSRAQSALYRFDGRITEVVSQVTLSNGLGWSADGASLYFVDTETERIDVFSFDVAQGRLFERRVFTDLSSVPGRPDGLSVDTDGNVWVAIANGGQVRCFGADGALREIVSVPAPKVTSCSFGGPDLVDLYITTGRWGMGPDRLRDFPTAGGLFVVPDTGVSGVPLNRLSLEELPWPDAM